jgi:ABC-type Mn2+/Zn2+ transport system ATPase subunit
MSTKEGVEQKQASTLARSFYGKLAIVGPTGAGKSYLSKTVDREHTGYINMERKPLPFK